MKPSALGVFLPTENAPETVEALLHRATAVGSSDVHLQRDGDASTISIRLDGVLVPFAAMGPGITGRVFGRIKYLARLKTYLESMPQEGRIEHAACGTREDVRVSTYPTVSGEKIVLRLFSSGESRTMDSLQLGDGIITLLRSVLRQPSGLLLLTGPAGSGKSTTIYACLHELATANRHVITVEDPVERVLPGIMQTEVSEDRGLTFARAARHLLRQDPEVLVIGEIRDDETARIALRAALTGHLLISTLHAGSCRGVFDRLLLLGIDASSLAATGGLVLNQRLLRRLCSECRGEGCATCLGTGYRGRVPAVETLAIDAQVRRALHAGELELLQPQISIETAARQLVEDGATDRREYERVIGHAP